MYLEKLKLQNYRSYQNRVFTFEPQGSLIVGPNGSGKTNLLEAIAYCGIGKSIRFHHDEQLLHFDTDYFCLHGNFQLDIDLGLAVNLSYRHKKKLLRLDNSSVKQLSSLFDSVKIIYCAPDDLLLVNGSPRWRRQYFDLAISQLFPEYIIVLRNYLHIVEQRNALLKKNFNKTEKEIWDTRFVEAYMEVLSYRNKYLKLLNQRWKDGTSPIDCTTQILYLYSFKRDPKELNAERFTTILQKLEDREKHYQRSLIGAHVDDYEFVMDGRNLKIYGSQGQKRTNVIYLKLIQAHLIEEVTAIKPILLFDDIFAELDLNHATGIRNAVDSNYQVLVASPRDDIRSIWKNMPVQYLGDQKCG